MHAAYLGIILLTSEIKSPVTKEKYMNKCCA